jgi:hypothetical protein
MRNAHLFLFALLLTVLYSCDKDDRVRLIPPIISDLIVSPERVETGEMFTVNAKVEHASIVQVIVTHQEEGYKVSQTAKVNNGHIIQDFYVDEKWPEGEYKVEVRSGQVSIATDLLIGPEPNISNVKINPYDVALGKSFTVSATVTNIKKVDLKIYSFWNSSVIMVNTTVDVVGNSFSKEIKVDGDLPTGDYMVLIKASDVEKFEYLYVYFEPASQMYINGSMNQWGQGQELIMNYQWWEAWEIELDLDVDTEFKFVTKKDWSGMNYGLGSQAGKVSAKESAPNIKPGLVGRYRIVFTEHGRTYELIPIKDLGSQFKIVFDPNQAIYTHAESQNGANWLTNNSAFQTNNYQAYYIGEPGMAFEYYDSEYLDEMWNARVVRMKKEGDKWVLPLDIQKILDYGYHQVWDDYDYLNGKLILVHNNDVDGFESFVGSGPFYTIIGGPNNNYWAFSTIENIGTHFVKVTGDWNGVLEGTTLPYLYMVVQ